RSHHYWQLSPAQPVGSCHDTYSICLLPSSLTLLRAAAAMPPTAAARCIRSCRPPSFGWLLIPIPDLICLSHFHTFGACFACERLTHEIGACGNGLISLARDPRPTPRNNPNAAKPRLWSMPWGALSDPKSRKNINAGDFYFGFEHPCSQMFAVEPSFIRIDIRGRTNLPQNRQKIHNEDINDTRCCITILAYFDANLVGTLVLVNVLFPANWSSNTTEFKCPQPSTIFEPTNPILHGRIWLNSDWMREGRKRNKMTRAFRPPHQGVIVWHSVIFQGDSVHVVPSREGLQGQQGAVSMLVSTRHHPHPLLVSLRTTAYRSTSFLPFPYPPVVRRREYRLHLASPRLPVLDYQQHPAARGTKSHCVGDRGELEAALSRTSLVTLELVQAMHSEVLGFCVGLRVQAMLRAWRVGAALQHAARARLFRVYYGSAQQERSVALTCRSGWAGECDYASGGRGLCRRRIQGALFTAGCTGMQRVSRGDNYIILPSRLTPIDQFGRAQHFAMKLGAIKNNYLIGLLWLARSTLLSTASAHNSDIHGERRPRLMRDRALPKREKTPERTFPSWYTLNVVADDELAWLENVDSEQGSLMQNLAVSGMIYQAGLWARDPDVSYMVSPERR
ncbi:hypothetical protein B0H14DRAFT_3662250, partial [Mycena olivaceomarginata]